ncbi:hypothetical protein ASZ90_004998 [hydrocarbon metagenome]|uniref:Uncharacterized protein n=1 Tax=hydrocarbon metagenome TaxID=938273 RepID=A0A0W8FWD2_9ZZZZ
MRLHRINTHYKQLFSEGIKEKIVRNDIPLDFILYYYTKITELAIYPDEEVTSRYTPKKVYQYLSRLFYEGAKS